jgi:protein involved in polysaccharide export with SLBB domain
VLKIYREKISRKDRSDLELDDLLQKITEGKRLIPRSEINIPIEEFILSGNLTYNIPLVPNDVLFIPTAGAVIVQGSVRNAGVTFLGPSMHTLTQVITERGGLRYGAHSRIEIIRTLRDGSQTSYFRDLRSMQDRAVEDFLLQDGDQIFIYSHWLRSSLEWIGAIFRASVATGVSATYSPVP